MDSVYNTSTKNASKFAGTLKEIYGKPSDFVWVVLEWDIKNGNRSRRQSFILTF